MKFKSFCLFLCFFLLFFVAGFFIYYLHKYPKPPDINRLKEIYPRDLILQTGGILEFHKGRIQHFLNFSPSKKANIIRIGAFGDSFTFGAEVDKKSAYPYYLQQLFNESFPGKVEVLNFGIRGVGFQEQFFLWEKYAKTYELDYILLGPRGFYPERDLTFSKNWNFEHFKYPKERYILSDKKNVKRVHIKGDTLKERYKNYYASLPTLTALHYDKNPFQVWEKFFPILRHNIQNPFYYKKMSFEESVKINILLLDKIRKLYDKKILFFTDDNVFFDNYQSVRKFYNLNLIQPMTDRFYEVFHHKSSLGNKFIAKIYFNAITGQEKFSLPTISCYFKRKFKKSKEIKNFHEVQSIQDFHEVQSIQVLSENIPIFVLRHNSFINPHENSYAVHKQKQTKSFIGFSNKKDILKSSYLPLSIQLKDNMKVYIRLNNKNKIQLGQIKPLDTYDKFFVFYGEYIKNILYSDYHIAPNQYEHIFFIEEMPFKLKNISSRIELFIGDYNLGRLAPYDYYGKRVLKLFPVNGYKKSFVMVGPSHHIKEKNLSYQFQLYMQYNTANGKNIKSLIPSLECKKEKLQINMELQNFKPLTFK